jgi:PhoH-like ATPase
LQELDGKRHSEGHVGKNARESVRLIDTISKEGNLFDGVSVGSQSIRVVHGDESRPTNDLKIVSCAQKVKATILSNDIGLRLLASGLGVSAESFEHKGQKDIYSGIGSLELSSELVDELYNNKKITLPNNITSRHSFYPNQMIILNGNTLCRAKRTGRDIVIELVEKKTPWGINPANSEQIFATELLMDKNVQLVSLIGKAGCGKTFLATATGLEQTINQKIYDKIIILRPIVTVGNDIGYLPGTIMEKMAPWIQPIKDNLSVLFKGNQRNIDIQFDNGVIVVEAMSYIRGRSIPNSLIIVDECQNISKNDLKTILTRAAEGSKIVLTGDIEQIDNKYLDIFSNGLSSVVHKFKDHSVAGHVTLTKGKRSELASLAADVL